MNPALIILVLIAAVVLWFLLSFVFYPLGKLVYRIYKDAVDEINRKDEDKRDEEGFHCSEKNDID
jgi:hypothetical protein